MASFNPVTVQEQNTMAPVPGAKCTECGTVLRVDSLQIANGAEVLISYWCPSNTCYRYGQCCKIFRLGELPKGGFSGGA